MKKFLPALLIGATVAVVPMASAQGWYADGGYTFAGIDEGGVDVDLGGVTLRGGYDFSPNFGVEAEGVIGVADDDFGGVSVELDHLVGVYGKGIWPVSDTVDLYGRAGVVEGELSVSGGGFGASDSDTGIAYGVGGTLDLTDRMYARGDYTRYDIDSLEADTFTLSLGLRF